MSNKIKQVADLIRESIPDNEEAYATAIYVASRHALMQSAEAGISTEQTSIVVSPEALRLVSSYDIGLTSNEFYMGNWSAIRAFMELDDIETHTKSMHLRRAEQTGDTQSERVVRDLVSPRYSALTFIVNKAMGRDVAEEFDFEMKRLTTISDDQAEYFKNTG